MIALITPTGERYKQIKLCALWMNHQNYEGKVLWIIVDDGEYSSTKFLQNFKKKNWEIVILRPTPYWKVGDNTQARNLCTAVEYIEKNAKEVESVFIIEDDDYYASTYLTTMCALLESYQVVAERNTIYYNLKAKGYRVMKNNAHGSLFETAFNIKYLSTFKKVINKKIKMIDIDFWKQIPEKDKKLVIFPNEVRLAFGIKGMSGRNGIGIGHDINWAERNMKKKPLELLIGSDASLYEKS